MKILRTPDEQFADLPDYPFAPHYTEVMDGAGGRLRMHHVEAGPADGEVVLCLHGQPSWSYLYRHMLPKFAEAGRRALAPDLVGFGRSDKPAEQTDYSYAAHVSWLHQWLLARDLTKITLFCQDWGGLLGLRVLAACPERFSRVVTANTGLPDSGRVPIALAETMRRVRSAMPLPDLQEVLHQFSSPGEIPAFFYWQKYCAEHPDFRPEEVLAGSVSGMSEPVKAAYMAPFPDETFLAGARRFPSLVPIMPDDPELISNDLAWNVLGRFDKPFLTAFSDSDPVTAGGERLFQERVPGAAGQEHVSIQGAGHFLQEDRGPELAKTVLDFMRANPLPGTSAA